MKINFNISQKSAIISAGILFILCAGLIVYSISSTIKSASLKTEFQTEIKTLKDKVATQQLKLSALPDEKTLCSATAAMEVKLKQAHSDTIAFAEQAATCIDLKAKLEQKGIL